VGKKGNTESASGTEPPQRDAENQCKAGKPVGKAVTLDWTGGTPFIELEGILKGALKKQKFRVIMRKEDRLPYMETRKKRTSTLP